MADRQTDAISDGHLNPTGPEPVAYPFLGELMISKNTAFIYKRNRSEHYQSRLPKTIMKTTLSYLTLLHGER